jgi:hypothetical protein
LVVSRTGIKDNETNLLLDRAIHGQSKITATDYISFGKAALKVMEAIPEGRRYVDAQAFGRLRDAVTVAGNSVMEWPNITGR